MLQTHSVSSLYLYWGNDLPFLPLAPACLQLKSSTFPSRFRILLSWVSTRSSSSSIHSRAESIRSINLSIFLFCFWTFFSRAMSSALLLVAFPLSHIRSLSTRLRTFRHSCPLVCTRASGLSHSHEGPVSLNWLPGYLELYLALQFQDPRNEPGSDGGTVPHRRSHLVEVDVVSLPVEDPHLGTHQ